MKFAEAVVGVIGSPEGLLAPQRQPLLYLFRKLSPRLVICKTDLVEVDAAARSRGVVTAHCEDEFDAIEASAVVIAIPRMGVYVNGVWRALKHAESVGAWTITIWPNGSTTGDHLAEEKESRAVRLGIEPGGLSPGHPDNGKGRVLEC